MTAETYKMRATAYKMYWINATAKMEEKWNTCKKNRVAADA